jgi:hypothetical protein
MNRKLTLPAFALAMMVGVSACDLAVVNQNQPDRDRALASPGDVETLIASSYQPYWGTTHYYTGAAFFSNVQSNRHTSAWGNFGMNDLGREPREEIPNTTSYSYRGNLADGWEEGYQGISAASDGLRALDSGLEIGGPGGPDNARARAFAKMVQGLSNCLLANWYDRAFQIDETVDIAGELALADYNTMFSYAMGFLDEAEQTARGNTFTLPDTWINGNALTNTQMADLIVSFKARCRANQPRNPSEADAVSWNLVANDAADGLGVLVVEGLTQGPWWDGMKVYGMENSTWHRQHMDWAGMADVSGEYQSWLAVPTAQRQARFMQFVDQRYPPTNVALDVGKYHMVNAGVSGRAERGTYRQSYYGDIPGPAGRYDYDLAFFGPMDDMSPREMRLLEAEAAFRQGNIPTTVAIVNETRVANGGLPPVVDGGTVPGGANCTPRKRYDTAGTCGDLRDALIYEHFEEVFQLYGGAEFFHGRRWGILPSGTANMIPIPASDLEVLQLPVYSFGGAAGTPPGTAPSVIPGDLNSALQRATVTLYGMEQLQKRLVREREGLVIR